MKAFAVVVVLVVFMVTLNLSSLVIWVLLKRVVAARDQAHIQALRVASDRLQSEGYLEAAEQFRDYADALEAKKGSAR
jgi:hypothetical protein